MQKIPDPILLVPNLSLKIIFIKNLNVNYDVRILNTQEDMGMGIVRYFTLVIVLLVGITTISAAHAEKIGPYFDENDIVRVPDVLRIFYCDEDRPWPAKTVYVENLDQVSNNSIEVSLPRIGGVTNEGVCFGGFMEIIDGTTDDALDKLHADDGDKIEVRRWFSTGGTDSINATYKDGPYISIDKAPSNHGGIITYYDKDRTWSTKKVYLKNLNLPDGAPNKDIDIMMNKIPGTQVYESGFVNFTDRTITEGEENKMTAREGDTIEVRRWPSTGMTDSLIIVNENPGTQEFMNSVSLDCQKFCEVGGIEDEDGDGICDVWENNLLSIDNPTEGPQCIAETSSYTFACDEDCTELDPMDLDLSPSDYDLLKSGIGSDMKDIFYEIDYEQGHKPNERALLGVIEAFFRNPEEPVRLHLQIDHKDSDEIPPKPCTHFPGLNDAFPITNQEGFDQIKQKFFGTPEERSSHEGSDDAFIIQKKQAVRYALFASDDCDHPGSSGWSEVEGDDIMITIGAATQSYNVGSVDEQAGTFMHEVGHNLGLHHGGKNPEAANCKPNYFSVMNYPYQFPGLDENWKLDYSKQKMPTLNESLLNESVDLSYPEIRSVVYGTPSPPTTYPLTTDTMFDWNLSGGVAEDPIPAQTNINDVEITGQNICLTEDHDPNEFENLEGWKDWEFDTGDSLVFDIKGSGPFAQGKAKIKKVSFQENSIGRIIPIGFELLEQDPYQLDHNMLFETHIQKELEKTHGKESATSILEKIKGINRGLPLDSPFDDGDYLSKLNDAFDGDLANDILQQKKEFHSHLVDNLAMDENEILEELTNDFTDESLSLVVKTIYDYKSTKLAKPNFLDHDLTIIRTLITGEGCLPSGFVRSFADKSDFGEKLFNYLSKKYRVCIGGGEEVDKNDLVTMRVASLDTLDNFFRINKSVGGIDKNKSLVTLIKEDIKNNKISQALEKLRTLYKNIEEDVENPIKKTQLLKKLGKEIKTYAKATNLFEIELKDKTKTLRPLIQINKGIDPKDVLCNAGLRLLVSADADRSTPAICISLTYQPLFESKGWIPS